jgi:hypothetical protein
MSLMLWLMKNDTGPCFEVPCIHQRRASHTAIVLDKSLFKMIFWPYHARLWTESRFSQEAVRFRVNLLGDYSCTHAIVRWREGSPNIPDFFVAQAQLYARNFVKIRPCSPIMLAMIV